MDMCFNLGNYNRIAHHRYIIKPKPGQG